MILKTYFVSTGIDKKINTSMIPFHLQRNFYTEHHEIVLEKIKYFGF